MLPALTKKWHFQVNLDPGRSGSVIGDCAKIFLVIKKALTSAIVPWQVVSSSNAEEFGPGDRVLEPRHVMAGYVGDAHTWVVLQHPVMAGQYCFAFCEGHEGRVKITWSPAGKFRGGTTDIAPEADDQFEVMSGDSWVGKMHRDGAATRVHVLSSEDGHATRVILTSMNRVSTLLAFDRPADATTGWSDPTVNLISTSEIGEASSFDMLMDFRPAVALGPEGIMSLKLTAEAVREEQAGVTYCSVLGYDMTMPADGYHDLVPVGLYHAEVVGQRGHHGHLNDVWWTSAAVPSGTTFPDDGTKQFAVFGNLVLPWNGQKVELG